MRLKINARALCASLCGALLILMHVSYYAGSLQTGIVTPYGVGWEPGNELVHTTQEFFAELWMTPLDAPFVASGLTLCEVQGGPRYWNPFRGVTYVYSETNAEEVTHCDLAEHSSFVGFPFLDVNFTPEGWSPESYWKGFEEEGFMRPLANTEVPSLFFFLVQYSLFAGLVWGVWKKGSKN